MPCINLKTNLTISEEQERSLRKKLGEAISIFPGKSENWLMLAFEDGCKMAFQGKAEEGIAFVEVKLLGNVDGRAAAQMTKEICKILKEDLKIEPGKAYIRYEPTEYWGWNGSNL